MRILIADHNTESLSEICQLLTKNQHEVFPAITSAQLIGIANQKAPDLIIIEVNLPEINGYSVCSLLRINPLTTNVPIFFLSSVPEKVDLQLMRRYIVQEIISKPLFFNELIYKINILQKKITTSQLKYDKDE